MEDSKLDVTAKQKDVEHKSARKESEAQQLRALATDLGAVQKEGEALDSYLIVIKAYMVYNRFNSI